MLRVMKRKLQQQETGPKGGVGLTWQTNSRSDSPSSPDSATRIVSHVPMNGSADSSLSPAQFHPFQSLSKKEDGQTYDDEPPKATVTVDGTALTHESSASTIEGSVETKPSPAAITPQHGFTRSISFVSRDVTCRPSQKPKKPRLEKAAHHAVVTKPMQGQTRLLLATAKDSSVLSPLHIFVRQQIEVFEASEGDLKQPAPGRRIPIQLNQVGLRCVHCKHQKARERKKRAVCYPSSVGRVYHSVSDMKFAHFPCQQMPKELQARFCEMKHESQLQSKLCKESGSKRIGSANASTAQYYHDSACELGMIDGKGGIFASQGLLCARTSTCGSPAPENGMLLAGRGTQPDPSLTLAAISQANTLRGILLGSFLPTIAYANAVAVASQGGPSRALDARALAPSPAAASPSMATTTAKLMPSLSVVPSMHKGGQTLAADSQPAGARILLTSEMDSQYLAPIHCFVRRHCEVFAANEQDLAAPAPGRKKPIVRGQVGLRCVHCARLPGKERVKRAICFPPATSGIYHALSNMKFDHFKHCKGMPKEAREEFQELSSAPSSSGTGSKRSGGGARPRVSNSTAQYYHDSALRMGLYDTPEGIRFRQEPNSIAGNDRTPKVTQVKGGAVPEGMEALIIAATTHERRQSPVAGPCIDCFTVL